MPEEMRTFTLDELAAFDGKEGRPAYVAHGGKVYDVTGSKLWKIGRHMNRHDAGLDLTVDLSQAPHGEDRLERYPLVGVLAEACVRSPERGPGDGHDMELPWILRKSPFLRRHPHPMTVHFPIAFATGAVLFLLGFLMTGADFCAQAVHAMDILGLLFTPAAVVTGLATWKYNYGTSMIPSIRAKLALSPLLFLQFLTLSLWWMLDPSVLAAGGTGKAAFCWLVLSMLPVMGVVGWAGASLTFPMHD